jgi:hypothetical protein
MLAIVNDRLSLLVRNYAGDVFKPNDVVLIEIGPGIGPR